jgi:hypothetical protein
MDTVVRISVYKADDVQTISMPDLTQTPPAFT